MKQLKLGHALAQAVLTGEKTSTWRLFDDKDLSVGDRVTLIDKVDPDDPATWSPIGIASIDEITSKRLGDITDADLRGHERFSSKQAMIAQYQKYYGPQVDEQSVVKIIRFSFSPELPDADAAGTAERAARAVVYADGGSRGNPGISASGYLIYDDQKHLLAHRGVYLGVTTNNQAEYTALRLALEEAHRLGAREVSVYMDSLLVINQMKGIFKVKNRDLWPIHDAIKQFCRQFKKVQFTQVPRELNKLADAAVNAAMDKQADVDLLHSEKIMV